MVSLFDWTLRSTYDDWLVHNLPLRGFRTFDQLSLLSPGVFRVPFTRGTGPAVGLGVGSAGQFSVNGFRGRSNNFTVDGSDNNDEDIGMRRQGFVALTPQTLESVEDFQVQTAGFLGEFGRNAGSMVNAVSRSGTNQIHGSVYGFFNDDAWNARNFFDHPFSDPVNPQHHSGGSFAGKDFRQNQVGGAVGGALLPGRLFYYVSYEHQRYRGSSLGHFVVPEVGERGLRVNPDWDPDGGGFVPIEDLGAFFEGFVPHSSAAGEGVFGLYPFPNNPAGPFGRHTYSQVKPSRGEGTILSGKIDWAVSGTHTFTTRYNFTNDESIIPFTGDSIDSSIATDTRTQNISSYWNAATPGFANMLRLSYGRTRLAFPPDLGSPLLFGSPPSDDLDPEAQQIIETSYGRFGPFGATGPVGQLSIAPYSSVGIDVFNFPQGRVSNTYQFADNLIFSLQSHNLQLGFEIRRSQLNSFSDRNSRPAYIFGHGLVSPGCSFDFDCAFATGDSRLRGTDLAALGAPAGVLQSLSTGTVPDTTIGLRLTHYDVFVQDNWRVRPNLTLNLGLRYELHTVPVEVNGRIEEAFGLSADQFEYLDPQAIPCPEELSEADGCDARDVVSAGTAGFQKALEGWQNFVAGRTKIYDADHNNLAPRVGLAWDPGGDGKTAIRAGYGIFYDSNLGAVTSQSRNVFPTFVPVNLDPNFNPPTGRFLNSPIFLVFTPTNERLVQPGTLNTIGLAEDSLTAGLGTLFNQAPPFPGASLSSNGLAFTLPEKQLEVPYGQHWVLSLQRQIGDHLASVNYVGTRGLHLTRFSTPNLGAVSTPVLFYPASGPQPLLILDLPPGSSPTTFGRPESDLGAYTSFQNSASSTYHSLQVSLEKRLTEGLHFRAHWTWAHASDDVSDPFDGRGFFALPQDVSRLDLERGPASFDVRHRLAGLFRWEFPQTFLKGTLEGWSVAAIGEFQKGQPFTVNTSYDRNLDGNLTDRLNSLDGLLNQPGSPNPVRLDASVDPFSLVADLGETGGVGRNNFRGDGLALVDLAISRRFSFRQEQAFHIRLEIFNLFNDTSFGTPVRILESPAFGRSYDTQTSPRSLRLGAKFSF